ncbi:MAG TPA: citrate synthase [Candidatus Merdivicinus faecavium]|nr:citrate synthase [Candidatus Merdivicinus faecavium]
MVRGFAKKETINTLCEEFKKHNYIDPSLNEKYNVKRGLRNSDGTGVLAGLTQICNVHGYVINEGEKQPVDGELTYRGYDIRDLISACAKEGRYGYEEVSYLLLFGVLPTAEQLEFFRMVLAQARSLPQDFVQDMILKAPSKDIMNKLARSVLALYSYDEFAEESSLEGELRKAIYIIARMPTMMVNAYQAKIGHYDNKSTYFHPVRPDESLAQSILSTLRIDREYTEEEAHLLDICLMLHAEHGGGNNSTFVCRTLTSSGTDAYSAYSGAIGSLKGFRHGGANISVVRMFDTIKKGVSDWKDDEEITAFLTGILDRRYGDRTGLIYGMGHAVYTLSDPRAQILRDSAERLAAEKGMTEELTLLKSIERLAPAAIASRKGDKKAICANVDLYSGFVYRMLGIPDELFTPLFAVARMSGWCAHRIEEYTTCSRIIRPAYKSVVRRQTYQPIEKRR